MDPPGIVESAVGWPVVPSCPPRLLVVGLYGLGQGPMGNESGVT